METLSGPATWPMATRNATLGLSAFEQAFVPASGASTAGERDQEAPGDGSVVDPD